MFIENKNCLQNDKKSEAHNIYTEDTEEINKIALSRNDDRRLQVELHHIKMGKYAREKYAKQSG